MGRGGGWMGDGEEITVRGHGGGGRFRTRGAVAKFLALSLCVVGKL